MKILPPQAVALSCLVLSCLVLTSAAGAARAESNANAIAPGYWETTSEVISPIHSSKVERHCIRPADVAKFMNGPSNHIYTCTYPTRVIGDGSIRLQGTCATKTGKPLPVSGSGTYTRDTFHLDAHVDAQIGPLQVPVHAVTDAHRLSAECPVETPASDAKPSDAG